MRTEHDLRSALRVLERETPDTGQVLSQVAERTSAKKAAPGRQPGRRLLAGTAAAAAVIAIAVAAALLVAPLRSRTAPPNASSVPRYYMALVPFNLRSYDQSGVFSGGYAVVKDRITGRTVATVQPPRPYTGFLAVTGAADDRTFVLTAMPTTMGSNQPDKFFYARFNPADGAVILTPLALTGLPTSNNYDGAALSPDGTKLAVAGVNKIFTVAQIKVYSLPSGVARTWSASVNTSMAFANDIYNLLSWSRTGALAIGWIGSTTGNAPGVYLLNTNRAGGSLLGDSRRAFCPVPVRQSGIVNISTYAGTNTAFLTPDGTTFISSVPQPIPVGQLPPSCTSRGLRATMPELEEFSASTGQATSLLYASHSHNAVSDVYWSNPSGSVLVVYAQTRPTFPSRGVFGILTGSTFTPIPGASNQQLTDPAF
jgi:hypothetical protein